MMLQAERAVHVRLVIRWVDYQIFLIATVYNDNSDKQDQTGLFNWRTMKKPKLIVKFH